MSKQKQKLENEQNKLLQLELQAKTLKRKRELTCQIFKISQRLKKLEGFESPEYKQAMAAVKKYCAQQNAKLKMNRFVGDPDEFEEVEFLRIPEENGGGCAIIHKPKK